MVVRVESAAVASDTVMAMPATVMARASSAAPGSTSATVIISPGSPRATAVTASSAAPAPTVASARACSTSWSDTEADRATAGLMTPPAMSAAEVWPPISSVVRQTPRRPSSAADRASAASTFARSCRVTVTS